ncbi:type I DNA topoisomerase [Candidatus Roizmanbacteria bacterium]|nr:type I DNA topoisomerase [Candidatus Roizmanbacteria bacterium]
MAAVIIVESPTKARTLSRFLGSDYRIEASMGHIRDLPEKKLGVDVEKNFQPTYEIPKKKEDVVKKLRSLVKDSSDIILATDPDREGEAIAWHVANILTKGNKKTSDFKRIVFHQITKSAIDEAMKHPRTIDMDLVDAQQGRRVLDRLMGYKLSPLLWSKSGKRWLSAGRVQSVAVRLIVEREREILAFVPEEFWELYATLRKHESGSMNQEFVAQLVKIGEDKAEVKNKEHSDKILTDLEKADYVVSSTKKTSHLRKPNPPFITSTLQRTAASFFGWSARKTMTIAQNLYEKGKITYHRTDSVHLAPEALQLAREHIEIAYGKKYLPEKPIMYVTKSKVAQEAHEAIRPTKIAKEKTAAAKSLGRDHDKLLDLITRRFLASQMNPQEVERTTVEVLANNKYLFRASGEREVFDGWRVLFPTKTETQTIPDVSDGDLLDLIKLDPQQKFTQPPARYNEASLIKTLEELSIGRPSTYAPIISTIQARQYVEKNENRAFYPTELGIAINDFLVKHFDDIINVTFTADMEDKLDQIANGSKAWEDTIRKFWGPFEKGIEKTQKNSEKIKIQGRKTGEKCPEDGGDLVEKIGKFGKFLACDNFPKCRFTKPIIQTLDMKCPQCGDGDVVIKKTRKGRKFFGCSNYPDCTFASWQKPEVKDPKTQGTKDPNEIIQKTT